MRKLEGEVKKRNRIKKNRKNMGGGGGTDKEKERGKKKRGRGKEEILGIKRRNDQIIQEGSKDILEKEKQKH